MLFYLFLLGYFSIKSFGSFLEPEGEYHNFYIKNNPFNDDIKILVESKGVGDELNPFNNLDEGLNKISKLTENMKNTTIFIYLIDDYYYYVPTNSSLISKFMNSVNNNNIFILPIACKKAETAQNIDDILSYINQNSINSVRWNIFVENLLFSISNYQLFLINIEFFGYDIVISTKYLIDGSIYINSIRKIISQCYLLFDGCCKNAKKNDNKFYKKYCYIKMKTKLSRSSIREKLILFNLISKNSIDPSTNIIALYNCNFNYLSSISEYYGNYQYLFFIEISDISTNKLTLNNVTFDKGYLPEGIVGTFYSKNITEEDQQKKIVSDTLITFLNVNIKNYNALLVTEDLSSYIYNEYLFHFMLATVYLDNFKAPNSKSLFKFDRSAALILNQIFELSENLKSFMKFGNQNEILIEKCKFICLNNYSYDLYLFELGDENMFGIYDSIITHFNGSYLFKIGSANSFTVKNLYIFNTMLSSDGSIFFFNDYNQVSLNNIYVLNAKEVEDYNNASPYYFSRENQIEISDCVFENNLFRSLSAVFYWKYKNTVNMHDSRLINVRNHEFSKLSLQFQNTNTFIASYNDFVYCNSIKFYNSSESFINFSNFLNFTSGYNEGGVLSLTYYSFGNISNCSFQNNYADKFGSVFYLYQGNYIIFKYSNFGNSTSAVYGGAVLMNKDNYIVASYNLFYNCTARLEGGFAYFFERNYIHISDSIFERVTSEQSSGGFIYVEEENELIFINLTMRDVFSSKDGGIIYSNRKSIINISNCSFETIMGSNGGAIYTDDNVVLEILYSYFENLVSLRNGGAIYARNNSNIIIRNCVILKSEAKNGGGSLYFVDNGILEMEWSFFCESISGTQPGGAFYFGERNNLTISNTVFWNIESKVDAGGIYVDKYNYFKYTMNKLLVSNSIWEGGAISFGNYNEGRILLSIFENIGSESEGGCFYFDADNIMEFSNVIISEIYRAEKGGVFYLEERNNLVINFSSISKTYASCEGLILYAGMECDIIFNSVLIKESHLNPILNQNFVVKNMRYEESQKSSPKNLNPMIYIAENCSFIVKNSSFDNLNSPLLISVFNSFFSVENTEFSNIQCSNFLFLVKNENDYDVGNDYIKSLNEKLFDNVIFYRIESEYVLYVQNSNFKLFNVKYFSRPMKYSFGKFFETESVKIEKSVFYSIAEHSKLLFGRFICLMAGFLEFSKSLAIIIKSIFLNGKGFQGGALYFEDSIFKIISCFFYNNKATNNGGVIYYDDIDFRQENNFILDSIFIKNSANKNGGSLYFNHAFHIKLKQTLVIKRSRFELNTANIKGGVIFISNFFSLSLLNCVFLRNEANNKNIGKGGVIYISNTESNESKIIQFQLKYSKCSFQYNKAFFGGVLYFDNFTVNIVNLNSIFYKNKAFGYGDINATEVIFYKFARMNQNLLNYSIKAQITEYSLSFDGLVSGNTYPDCLLKLIPYDYFGQIAYKTDFNYSLLEMNADFNLTHLPESGFYCLKGLFLNKKPNGDSLINKFKLNTKIVKYYNYTPEIDNLNFVFIFRPCIIGERLTDDNRCIECPENTYSFNREFKGTSELCKPCDNKNFNCYGGNRLTPKPTFWRISNQSDNFIRCRYPEACLGDDRQPKLKNVSYKNNLTNQILVQSQYNESLATGVCSSGYKGIMCGECDDGYGKDITKKNKCSKCESSKQILMLLVLFIFKTFFILWSIHKAIEMCVTISSDDVDINKVITNNLIKMVINHFQSLTLIFSLPINWPLSIDDSESFLFLSSNTISQGLSYECIFKNFFPDRFSNFPSHYFKLIINWIYPFFLVSLCMIYIKIYARFFGNEYIKKLVNEKLVKFLTHLFQPLYFIVLSIYFCDSIQIVLQTFSCVDVGYQNNSHYVMLDDVSVVCWENEHYNYRMKVAFPFGIIFGIFFPVSIFIILLRKWRKNKLDEKSILFKYGYFYYGLEHNFFYWDLVILFRKVLITTAGLFYMSSFSSRKDYILLLVFLLLVLALYFQISFKPYRSDKLNIINKLETKSLITLAGSLYIGIFTLEFDDVSGEVGLFLFLGIIGLNLYFLINWIHAFFVFNLRYLYLEIKSFLKKYLGKYSFIMNNSEFFEGLANSPTIKKRSGEFSALKRKKTRLGLLFQQNENVKSNFSINDSQIIDIKNEQKDIEKYYEEKLNINYNEIKDNEKIDDKIGSRRRGGLTIENSEISIKKRRFIFNEPDYDNEDINLIKFYCLSKEAPIFILIQNNEDLLPENQEEIFETIFIEVSTILSIEGLVKMDVKIRNNGPTLINLIEIKLKDNSELMISCIQNLIYENLEPFSEKSFTFLIKYIDIPFSLLMATLKIEIGEISRKIKTLLPSSLNKFIKFENISEKNFNRCWKNKNYSISVLGPFSNSKLIFKTKDELFELFQGKLSLNKQPYYRREASKYNKMFKESYYCLLDLVIEKKTYLIKITQTVNDTTFKFCYVQQLHDSDDEWKNYCFYETFTYLLIIDD